MINTAVNLLGPSQKKHIYLLSSAFCYIHCQANISRPSFKPLEKPIFTVRHVYPLKSSHTDTQSFSAVLSEMSEESCWLSGLWFICGTSVSHRAWNLLQPWISQQTTSPCVRTRWLCILTFLSKLILICWYVMAPNKMFWCCLTKMYAACCYFFKPDDIFGHFPELGR